MNQKRHLGFFINVVDNDFLNQKTKRPWASRYAVFGKRGLKYGCGGQIKDVPLSTQVKLECPR